MKVFVYHPTSKDNPVTYAATDVLTGATSVKVKNTVGFTTDKYAIIGKLGYEQTELSRPTTVTSPDTLAFAALKFPHNADTPLTFLDYDKVKIYRSTTGIGGSFSLLATVDIQVDSQTTMYEDVNSQPTYYYKFSYYNSNSTNESDLSDAIAATGFVLYSLKSMCERVLSLYGDTKQEQITIEEVSIWINEFFELAQTKLAINTKRFNIQTYTIPLVSGTREYALPANLLVEVGVRLSTDGGVNFNYGVPMRNMDSTGTVIQNNMKYSYNIYNGLIELDETPTSTNEVLKIYYVSTTTTLVFQTDTLPAPFTNKSAMFVDYGLARCYLKDKKFIEYQDIQAQALNQLEDHLSFIRKISNRHPQYVEIQG